MTAAERKPPGHSVADVRRKVVIALIVAGSTAILLWSLGLALGHTWITLGAVAAGVATAASLTRRVIPTCPRPTAGEIALAAATATYTIAAVAFAWWGVFWAIHAVLAVLDSVIAGGIAEDRIAWWICLVLFGPLVVVAAARAAYEMEAELYPATGLRSRYRDVIRFRGRTLAWRTVAVVVVLAAFIGVSIAADLDRETVGAWLLIGFGVGGAAFAVPAGAERLGSVRTPNVKRVADCAEAAGWRVLPNPQIGDVGIDPFLAEVDLFARKGSLAMLVKVVQGDTGTVAEGRLDPVGWPVVATVLTAARSLPKNQLPEGVETVEPVLVLIDAELQSEPLLFAADNGVALLSVDGSSTWARAPAVPRLEGELQAIGDDYRSARATKAGAPA
jgi:hypothetical protein